MICKLKLKYLECDIDHIFKIFYLNYPFHYSKSLLDYLRVIY